MRKSSALKLLLINIVLLAIVLTESPIMYPEPIQLPQSTVQQLPMTTHRIYQRDFQAVPIMAPVLGPQTLTRGTYQFQNHKNQNVNDEQKDSQVQSNDPNGGQGNNGFRPINRMYNLQGMRNPKFGKRRTGCHSQKRLKSKIAKLKLENKELLKITKRLIKDKVYYRRKVRKYRKKYGIKKNKRRNRIRGNKRRNRRQNRRRGIMRRLHHRGGFRRNRFNRNR